MKVLYTINIKCDFIKFNQFIKSLNIINIFYIENGKYINGTEIYTDNKVLIPMLEWTNEDHSILEQSLKKNKKELFINNKVRWEKIASEIPGKSIKDCLNHTKYIKEYLKTYKDSKKIFYQFKNNVKNNFKYKIILIDVTNNLEKI